MCFTKHFDVLWYSKKSFLLFKNSLYAILEDSVAGAETAATVVVSARADVGSMVGFTAVVVLRVLVPVPMIGLNHRMLYYNQVFY